jgi:phenylpropionate dioxygenase-like ring-hydroxylating dioxygenase large terminal subunit
MRTETQIELVERAARHIREGTTDEAPSSLRVPAAHYVDDAQTAREIELLFRRRPLLVALSPDLPGSGAYLAHEAGDVSLLLVRDDEGRARAYLNACRHRGARLAEGRGKARVFSCPFHAWTWRRDGRLAGRPNSNGGFDAVDALCDRLWERPCLEIAGLVFVLLEGDGIEEQVRALLGDALDEIESYGIGDTVYFDSREAERDCSYKLIVDGFAEAYHIAPLHRDTISPYYYTTPGLTDRFGRTVRMIGLRRSLDAELEKPPASRRLLRHATTQYLIPPNVVLTHQVDHIQLWRVHPVGGAHRCRVELGLYWPAPMDEEARRKARFNIDVIWKVTTEEDFAQSVAIHHNLASGAAPELFFGRNEPALVYWHQGIAEGIGSRLLEVAPG